MATPLEVEDRLRRARRRSMELGNQIREAQARGASEDEMRRLTNEGEQAILAMQALEREWIGAVNSSPGRWQGMSDYGPVEVGGGWSSRSMREPAGGPSPWAGGSSWGSAARDQLGDGRGHSFAMGNGSLTVPSPIAEPIRDPERPRFVSDLIPVVPIDNASSVTYLQQTVRSNMAAAVSMGQTKPESSYQMDRVESPVATIAHVVSDVPRNDLADSSQLERFLDAEMRFGLRVAVDEQILDGSGSSPELEGLLVNDDVQDQSFATDRITSIRKGVTKLELEHFVATGLILHPNDAEALDLVVDGEQRYFFGGPSESGPPRIWSVPVVRTVAMTAGIALLGDFRAGAIIWSRETARVDSSEALGFKENLVTFRAELRLAFGILRPLAFCRVDLTA